MITIDMLLDDTPADPDAHPGCVGISYRFRRTEWFGGDRMKITETFSKLKSMSCCGCPNCSWIYDFINDCGYMPAFPDGLDDMDIVTMHVIPGRAGSWGHDDGEDPEIELVKLSPEDYFIKLEAKIKEKQWLREMKQKYPTSTR